MCSSGTLVEIHKTLLQDQKVYWGLLMTYSQQLVSFWAVGSTGKLVENHGAKFCGFVTGLYDYNNSSGGAGHAVEAVGYFQLPENKRSPAIITAPVPEAPSPNLSSYRKLMYHLWRRPGQTSVAVLRSELQPRSPLKHQGGIRRADRIHPRQIQKPRRQLPNHRHGLLWIPFAE